MKVVAVEPALNNVKEYLESQGCECVEMRGDAIAQDACCCVVTGADNNLMGMEDVVQDVPVISAEGMSPEQVYDRVKSYLQ
ncbi:YkuS family protein [Alicyclobacillus cycloheptanicus]|uniref:Uncharacterized protein n=1 Tax=Alicyclobacillus cycloheptanicus TaxID=1457 RepID=A0ABT9XM62_9BACL|nr:YkuS family protein [Alicyclobacillus cycloheptanicus]MDQ0191119.1 hypothetical protein [Alicyclobacillus cycloheptanicus]WDM02744.1 YkuS family protein [Alicyclobacillus cycloheptanicus]